MSFWRYATATKTYHTFDSPPRVSAVGVGERAENVIVPLCGWHSKTSWSFPVPTADIDRELLCRRCLRCIKP